jgi:hypothetical protein
VRASLTEGRPRAAFDGRLGYRFGLPRSFHFHTVIFNPEIIVGYIDFRDRHGDETKMGRFGFGGRVGLSLGYFELFSLAHASPTWDLDSVHMLYDAGCAIDARAPLSDGVWPHLSFGLHGTYNTWTATPREHWFEYGGHLEYHWPLD